MSMRVALITGAARRIGAEIARRFHQAGYNVVLHYNQSASEAEALAHELNSTRADSAITMQAELGNIKQLQNMATQVVDWKDRVDVLINNASSFYPTPLESASENDWGNLINSNLKGPYFLTQALIKTLKSNNGCIINIADIYARQPLKNYSIYSIAKAGNIMLTKSLAKELAPEVRVNGIAPGAILWPEKEGPEIKSPETKNPEKESPDFPQQSIIDSIPLGRIGSPADIANTALFLANDASYMTGHTINVDGGRNMNI